MLFSGDAFNPSLLSTITQASASACMPPARATPTYLPSSLRVAELAAGHMHVPQGKQMVEVLNSFGTKAACVGNHDFGACPAAQPPLARRRP